MNGKTAKASLNVKNGDVLEIQFGNKTVKAEILDVKDTAIAATNSVLFMINSS